MLNSVDPDVVVRQSECGQCLGWVKMEWLMCWRIWEDIECYPIDLQRVDKKQNAFVTDVASSKFEFRQCLRSVQWFDKEWTQEDLVSPDSFLMHHSDIEHPSSIFYSTVDPTLSVSDKRGNDERWSDGWHDWVTLLTLNASARCSISSGFNLFLCRFNVVCRCKKHWQSHWESR